MIPEFQLPDWLPFACLVTGKLQRKPMFTRLAESIILGIITSALSFAFAEKMLEQKVDDFKSQFVEYVDQDREAHKETRRAIEEINRCLRERTCTK